MTTPTNLARRLREQPPQTIGEAMQALEEWRNHPREDRWWRIEAEGADMFNVHLIDERTEHFGCEIDDLPSAITSALLEALGDG